MVDITPEDIKMKQKFTQVDKGELEFQLGYFTHLTAKVLQNNENTIDVLLVKSKVCDDYISESLEYIVDLSIMENEIKNRGIYQIHGKDDILYKITRALETFNRWWVI